MNLGQSHFGFNPVQKLFTLKLKTMTQKIYRKKPLFIALMISMALAFVVSCEDDDDKAAKELLTDRTVNLDTKQEIPTVMDRMETGTSNLKLFGDSTLDFTITVSNLDPTDQLTVAHIHVGSPVDVGAPLIPLVDNTKIKFQGGSATGTVKLNLPQFNNMKDALGKELYLNVHSTKFPNGLVRGQLDQEITYAQNIDLTPISNPLRPETGTAILRLKKENVLVYKITVNNLTPGDSLGTAQINVGATGITGPVVIPLYATAAEYDTTKSITLDASQSSFLLNDEVYISVNSTQVPAELLRGQIR